MQELKADYTIVIVTHNMQQAARVSDMTAFFTAEVDAEADTPHRRAGRVRPHREDLHHAQRRAHRGLRQRAVRLMPTQPMPETRKIFHEELAELETDVVRLSAMASEAIQAGTGSLLDVRPHRGRGRHRRRRLHGRPGLRHRGAGLPPPGPPAADGGRPAHPGHHRCGSSTSWSASAT